MMFFSKRTVIFPKASRPINLVDKYKWLEGIVAAMKMRVWHHIAVILSSLYARFAASPMTRRSNQFSRLERSTRRRTMCMSVVIPIKKNCQICFYTDFLAFYTSIYAINVTGAFSLPLSIVANLPTSINHSSPTLYIITYSRISVIYLLLRGSIMKH